MNRIKQSAILILFFANCILAGEIKDSEEKKILNEFPGARLQFKEFEIPVNIKNEIEHNVRQRFFMSSVYVWKIYKGDKLEAISILDNVIGKTLPITFRVNFNTEGKIIASQIVKYRESIGGGVSNESWNKQFTGKNSKSSYKVGESIDGISGATISVNSVTKGIQKLTMLVEYILDDEKE